MKAMRFLLSVPRSCGTGEPIELHHIDRPNLSGDGHPILWADHNLPVINLHDQGFIIGVLFSRATGERLRSLPSEAPISDGTGLLAAWIVRECWGGYAGILLGPEKSSINIIVDPSGYCPVYRLETATHILYATSPGLFAEAMGVRLSVSWADLHSFLARPELRQRGTCLQGVMEIAPGELVSTFQDRFVSKRIWRAEDYMPDGVTTDFDDAAAGLREVAVMVCAAWAELFGPVTVAASGGVDSSLICAALAAADMPFTCTTVATSDPSGDERRFVQLLAGHLGVQCISAIYDPSAIDPLGTISIGLPRPSRKPFMQALDAALLLGADESGASVVFDGNVGDNLFCYLHSSAPIVDRFRSEGFGRGTLSTFHDMCLVTGCDIPTMARAAGRRIMKRSSIPEWPPDLRFLVRTVEFPDIIDPLTPAQLHIHGLADCGLPRFTPLASQPLLEYCLKIPTWLWCQGGVNRALARAAFAPSLPREIVTRTSKAGPDSFIQRSFEQHRKVIQELLMDGLLTRHRVIDRAAVDAAFQNNGHADNDILLRLVDLAEAENWARSWLN
jgi:asparagine synthase (glutamine-hydrolysing)